MSTELRDLIVTMRKEGGTYRGIAAQLGLSTAKVQRELTKAAREVTERGAGVADLGPGAAGGGLPAIAPTMAGLELASSTMLDPDIRERRRRLEIRKLELEESRLEHHALEMQNRTAVLRGGQAGGDSTMLAYVLSELARLREAAVGGGPGQSKPPSMLDTLSEFRQVGEIVKSFAPPNPASREDLELQIAVQRINAESQRILREREEELSMQRRRIEGQAARDDAIAKMIEQFGPVLGAYLEKRVAGPPAGAEPASDGRAMLSADNRGGGQLPASAAAASARGHCPRCQYPPGEQEMELTPTGTEADKCPGCGALLGVRDGSLVLVGDQGLPAAAAAATAGASSPNGHNANATTPGAPPQTFTF